MDARSGRRRGGAHGHCSAEAWARFLMSPLEDRRLPRDDVQLDGRRADVQMFTNAFFAQLARS
jgi:hypothetical protein